MILAMEGEEARIDGSGEVELGASAEHGKSGVDTVLKYALVLNPVLVAFGTIMMRQMKKLNENVVSCYMNFCSIPFMIALCFATGSDLSAWGDFDAL